jgi:hypothetical protein
VGVIAKKKMVHVIVKYGREQVLKENKIGGPMDGFSDNDKMNLFNSKICRSEILQ